MSDLTFHPLTAERWPDLEALFGPQGAYGGCWCMWWRIKRKELERNGTEGNRRALRAIVERGEVAGLLAYRDGEPVGWCSVAPREAYPTLDRSPVLKRLDDTPVWSIVCFYVAPEHRGEGLVGALLEAAVDYARMQGAKVLEAYPTEPRGRQLPPVSSYMGLPELFARAGFVEWARPSQAKVVMRRSLE